MMPKDKKRIIEQLKWHYHNVRYELGTFSFGVILLGLFMVFEFIKFGKLPHSASLFEILIFSLLYIIFPISWFLILYKVGFEKSNYSLSELKLFFKEKLSELRAQTSTLKKALILYKIGWGSLFLFFFAFAIVFMSYGFIRGFMVKPISEIVAKYFH